MSNAALRKQELRSELEKVRAKRDLVVSRAVEATKECEAIKEEACFEGERVAYIDNENRTLQAKIKAVER